jgi:predicted phage terminase large subunit-like protein
MTSLIERAVENLGRERVLEAFKTAGERAAAPFIWELHRREKQVPPDDPDWLVWMLLMGRGWGKTRTGGEWVRAQIESEKCGRMALVAPTSADGRDVMVEGESGLLEICPPWNRPVYEPSKRRVSWPNGAIATIYSAEEPDRLRGPQHDGAWCDELASWKYPESWDMLLFGLRLGDQPRVVVTTTPRPVPHVKALAGLPTTRVVRGSTYENRSNLAPTYFTSIIEKYEGTRLGRQEIYAELLEDVEGALWHHPWIDQNRVTLAAFTASTVSITRMVVAIDPAVTHGENSDDTGIVVAGRGDDGDFYVFHGSGYQLSPDGWAKRAVDLYDQYGADRMIGERNNGGDMVELTLRSVRREIPLTTIHASRGKTVRAEPVAALYEQGKIHHVGTFADMEDQMCAFPVSADHDDMVDALVYALTSLQTRVEPNIRFLE